jgi:predicted ester cyclase
MGSDRKDKAERFMRAVYGGDAGVVDELAADDIALSYPVFESVFNTPTLRGKKAVRAFAERFVTKWADGKLTIHASVEEGDRVVLLWSFRARQVGALANGAPPTGKESRWGGITLYRFDQAGKIIEELGEESAPGPFARLLAGTP